MHGLVNLGQSKDKVSSKAACKFNFFWSFKTLRTFGYPTYQFRYKTSVQKKPRRHTKYQEVCIIFQNGNDLNIQKMFQGNKHLRRVAQWVQALQLGLFGRFLIQTSLGAQLGLQTQPSYEALGDF